MVKASGSDILAILRRFNLADEDNIARHVQMLESYHPDPKNTLFSFRFNQSRYYILFDDTAEDDIDYIKAQVHAIDDSARGKLHPNPHVDFLTYALPFKGKECYLFQALSDKKRLDLELAVRYPDMSRSTWQKLIKAGHVRVNGTLQTSPRYGITENDLIAIDAPETIDHSKESLPILYLDDDVIVVDKPAGILSHAKGELNSEFTVADFFRRYTSFGLETNRPGIVHRLDRDTSGVMIGARHQAAAQHIQKQFSNRKVIKTYHAILNGQLSNPQAMIDLPIARNNAAPSTFKVDPKGKAATTRYRVISSDGGLSLVELLPETGRTHQLRVHMKYLNTPIKGDRVYGKNSDRLYLHASKLELTLPGGIRREFSSDLPVEFSDIFPDFVKS